MGNDPANKTDPTGMYGGSEWHDEQGLAGGRAIASAVAASPSQWDDALIFAPLAFMAAPVAWEAGIWAMANPLFATEATITVGEGLAGDALGGAALVSATTLAANKVGGDRVANFLADTYGAASEITEETTRGRRVLDMLTDSGSAVESKTGRVSLTEEIREQVLKDYELLQTPGNGINAVEWQFSPGATGTGPTKPLEQLLNSCGISICILP